MLPASHVSRRLGCALAVLACASVADANATVATSAGATSATAATRAGADSTRIRFGRHNVPAWPVYVSWEWEDARSLRVFGPVTALYRAPGYASFYPAYPVTGARRWRNGKNAFRAVWPLLYSESDPARGTWSVNLATPLLSVRSARGPGYRDLSFLPLYHSQRTPAGKRTHMVVPFRRRVQEPLGHRLDETWGFVPLGTEPLIWLYRGWRNEHGHGWNSAWFYGAWTADSSRYASLPPWFAFDRRTPGGTADRLRLLAPLFADYRRRGPAGARTDARSLLLLHYAQSDVTAGGDSARFTMTLPFHVARRATTNGRETRLGLVLPFYGAWRTPERELRAALPSWWSYRSATLASRGLWPLYASFERTRADSSVRTGASFAWPLVTWGRGDNYSTFGVLPLYFSLRDGERRFSAAPPIYWHARGPDREWRVITPLYGSLRAPNRQWRVIVPFHASSRGPTDSTKVVFNWYRVSRDGLTRTGLVPFYERAGSADAGHFVVPPFWIHAWSSRGDTRIAALLWGDWRSKVDGSHTRLVGPVLTTSGPGTSGFGILPVYYSTRGPDASRTLIGPLFTSRNSRGVRHTVVVPLAWYRSSPSGWAIDLLPLSGYRSSTDGQRQLYVLGPTFLRRVQSPTRRTSALLGWLWRDEVNGAKHRSMLQPLYYLERKAQDDVYFSLLGGLLGSYEREGRNRQVKVLFVPVKTWEK